MNRRRNAQATAVQVAALAELRTLAETGTTPLVGVTKMGVSERDLVVSIRLRTEEISRQQRGLPLRADFEDFLIHVPPGFPLIPIAIRVDHGRFAGYPHVLQGDRLCIFLDTDQEWHPRLGVVGFLDRLWLWLNDASQGRFDPRTALYHPVGGVLHASPGAPIIVVRQALNLGRWSMVEDGLVVDRALGST
jgi:E2/UBC family protein A